jgi:hypothetical protein
VGKSRAALRTARLLDDRLPEVLELVADEAWENGDLNRAESLFLQAINILGFEGEASPGSGLVLSVQA